MGNPDFLRIRTLTFIFLLEDLPLPFALAFALTLALVLGLTFVLVVPLVATALVAARLREYQYVCLWSIVGSAYLASWSSGNAYRESNEESQQRFGEQHAVYRGGGFSRSRKRSRRSSMTSTELES